jgi:hypothetical protein
MLGRGFDISFFMFSNMSFIISLCLSSRLPVNPNGKAAAMFVMYNILTSGDVNTFEVVFPTYDGKPQDNAIGYYS